MSAYIESMIILPLLIFSYQIYSFSARGEGVMRQGRCLKTGVFFMTSGVMALIFKSAPTAFFGLFLMMLGFRLLAKGLDRLDKKIHIDRYDDDTE